MTEQSLDKGLLHLKAGRSRGFRAYYRAAVIDGLTVTVSIRSQRYRAVTVACNFHKVYLPERWLKKIKPSS